MPSRVTMRSTAVLVAYATATVPSLAAAQEWSLRSGFTARGEYNDNYFFTPTGAELAFTASASPFVTAARRTEASEVTALLAIGANRVWGPSPTSDYLSARVGLTGSLREERSTWMGDFSFARNPELQNEITPAGTVLTLANSNSAVLNGAYAYEIAERWRLGVNAGAFDNQYDRVQGGGTLQNNRGYYAGGTVTYAYSERTQLKLAAMPSYYASDVTRGDSVTATLGVVHEFSPQLTISGSIGGFWSDMETTQDTVSSNRRRDSGWLYGGDIRYAYSERTQFAAGLSENLVPSGTGTLDKTDSATASVSHRFSDRFTGHLGAGYTRTVVPARLGGSSKSNYYTGETGVTYRFAERWALDCGYRYSRADYSQSAGGEPRANIFFVSIGYNWPGASFTDWLGTRADTQGLPGAGPLSLPDRSRGAPGSVEPTGMRGPPEGPPSDQFTIP